MRVYVASSWRNEKQPKVVEALRKEGFDVYDFHNSEPDDQGFHWSEIDLKWKEWTPEQFVEALKHPLAYTAYKKDFVAMQGSDVLVLVTPCGKSTHLEAGWARGAGKRTVALLSDGEPELMYNLIDHFCTSVGGVVDTLKMIRKAYCDAMHIQDQLGGGIR